MTCTKGSEPLETGTWNDNFLCLPSGSSEKLAWSDAGVTSPAPVLTRGRRSARLARMTMRALNDSHSSSRCRC